MRGGPSPGSSATGKAEKPCEVCRQSSYRVRNLQKSVRSGSGFQTSRYRESGRPCAVAMLSWPPREKNAEKCVRWPGFPDLCDRNVSETVRGEPSSSSSAPGKAEKPCEVCRQSSYRVRNPQKSVRSGSGFQTSRYRESGRPCAVAMLSWPPREKNAEKCVRWPGFPDLCDRNVSETVRGEPSSSSSAPGKAEKPCEVCRQSSYRVRNPQKSVRSGSGLRTSRYRESGRPCVVAMLS